MSTRHLHHPRRVRPPKPTVSQPRLRLTFATDLVAFIHAPTTQGYNRLTRLLDVLAVALAAQRAPDALVQIHSARRAMAAIFGRWERTGMVALSRLDELTLRAAAPHVESALGRTRLDAFNLAHALVKAQLQAQGDTIID